MHRTGRVDRAWKADIETVSVLNCKKIENGCFTDIQINSRIQARTPYILKNIARRPREIAYDGNDIVDAEQE